MAYDFDKPTDRRGTCSVKWDTTPAGVIPMWVADMDFEAAPCILRALRKRLDSGVFGYTHVPEEYYRAIDGWFRRRHNYAVDPSWVIYVPGIVPAMAAVIKAVAQGQGVIIQNPAYNCFFSSIRNYGCDMLLNPLVRRDLPDGRFTYDLDFDGLEALCSRPDARMLLFCNPHNPGGRVWTRDELLRVAEICRRHDVLLVSDEIHCELTMPGHRFTSVAELPREYSAHAVVFSSPSKAFNIAGLQIANIVVPDPELRARIDRAVNINEVCDVNPFGVVALIAAYTEGEPWLAELCEYLHGNYSLFCREMLARFPLCRISRLEVTYLVWVDVSAYGSSDEVAERLLARGVRVSPGSMYGDNRYVRFNLALQRPVLREALSRIDLNP